MPEVLIQADRYHDISCGHRVHGHESKCAHLHGHNYRIHFFVEAKQLDQVGRVLDFSEIKRTLCMWLEDNWDHKFLAWDQDPIMRDVFYGLVGNISFSNTRTIQESIVFVPFNPTAENMAEYLLTVIGPELLEGCTLTKVVIEETAKCHASASLK